ncbi:MAG TPA: hypothetical protein VN578_00525 [Candidatus Binatia bacterium]|jgi:hypothetical protein|nr:hypothetical protein [Candidatus Binatia bacterium]
MRVSDYKDLRVDHICAQLTNMMNDAASWCGTGCELREVPAEYFVNESERESVSNTGQRSNPPDAPRSDAPHTLTL